MGQYQYLIHYETDTGIVDEFFTVEEYVGVIVTEIYTGRYNPAHSPMSSDLKSLTVYSLSPCQDKK